MLRRLGTHTAPRLRSVQNRNITLSGYSASSEQSVSIDHQSEGGSSLPPLELRTGHMARFADAAVVASRGDSAVLATVVTKAADPSAAGAGFTPLTVDFRQSAAAVGKIPTNYLRRELAQSDTDILISRVIDRSLRPLIPATVADQIQLHCKPLATDEDADPVTLAVNAASTALQLSPIPTIAASAAVRVAIVDGKPLVNPPRAALRHAAADLLLTGAGVDGAPRTIMIEMDGKQIALEQLEEAMDAGLNEVERVIRGINRLAERAGKEKRVPPAVSYAKVDADLLEMCGMQLEFVLTESRHDKISRDVAIQAALGEALPGLRQKYDEQLIRQRYAVLVKKMLRSLILRSSIRCDGRKIDEFRPISIQVDVFKKLHGSALFQRGQTQLLSTCTFDAPSAAFHPDSIAQLLGSQRKKSFLLHYEFPGYATNEITIGRGGANRRELGHGALAEKALKHLVPDNFPFCVRLACQVLESNGSSSMASVCAGSMSLLDAGVPIKAQAAGVAIGLITDETNPDEKYEILTDLGGIEDYAGDMDFKMAGTTAGFTAMQLDVKTSGLTRKQLHESLVRGRSAIDRLVKRQDKEIAAPREQFKSTVPVLESLQLESYKRMMLFRGGAMGAKHVEAETGVKVSIEDDRHVSLTAPNREQLERAKNIIKELVAETDETAIDFGKMITVEIVAVHDGGVSVKITPTGKSYFMPNKQLHSTPIEHPSAIGLKVTDRITVQWLGRDSVTGAARLSRRALQGAAGAASNAFKRK
ncbi:hypothetical protein PFISCL1PPCAC_29120 [Pristionchus fissidentatus]|uniref:polyribonucleotide nucleotidyltransferase n=1 Tax=Pristionchus fissidentatus TaxID=1538716 RepID=A0AAV5X3H7_9BILA|nr:hypothetical protein PFISCL1PPCAC_22571 [Pristionchus fissidentatus]GMT37823.1 hypothetical protein PFISCL1PPCAC_29120 [Pristionchus fissidentatus]